MKLCVYKTPIGKSGHTCDQICKMYIVCSQFNVHFSPPLNGYNTVRGKILEGENFGEFGERLAIRQNFPHQYL